MPSPSTRWSSKALLVFHSPNDKIVRPENADQIYQAAQHPKSLVSPDDADHLLTRKEDAEYVAVVLSAWASRYIDGDETVDTSSPQLNPES